MEALIPGVLTLTAVAVFLALNLLPFYVLYEVGKKWGSRINRPALRWLLPTAPYIVVMSWAGASLFAFQSDCKSVPGISRQSTQVGVPHGFVLRGARDAFTTDVFSWQAALERGTFQFVDLEFGRRCIGKKQHELQPSFPVETTCDKSLSSDVVVILHPPRAVERWWRPPIFHAQIEVQDAKTGRALATGTDLIFGGGFVGVYLRFFGGDQDYARLSCGYASSGIGPWRPTLTGRPRILEYRDADLRLLNASMGNR